MLLRQEASLLQATAPRDPKPLAELSPREGQHSYALLQQWQMSLCPSSGWKHLLLPCKALMCAPAPALQVLGDMAHGGRGEKG